MLSMLRHAEGRLGLDGGAGRRQLRHQEGRHLLVPVTCSKGKYKVVKGLEVDLFSRERMVATERELWEEREGVKDLLGPAA